ncbi:MAG TPA: thioesterase [Bacteroidales bacterium]|nr:thioesterase [Bacteroidales bacterium]
MIIHERNYSVNVCQADIKEQLSLYGLFDLFQDIAGRHASILGFGREHLMINRNFWVLSRLSARISSMPAQWSDVTLRTWPRGTDGIFAIRDFEMMSSSGEKIIGASSSWVIVDYDSRRLQRPDKALSVLNQKFPDQQALSENAVKIGALQEAGRSVSKHIVTTSDLDINMHVNNAVYIKWIYDSYTPEFINTHVPEAIDVNYVSECHYGDDISVITVPEKQVDGSFIHSVMKNETEMCRIRLKWRGDNL